MIALTITSFLIVKFFHVFLAIVAVGVNVSYGAWLTRASKEPEHELHVVRGIKFLDDRIANPAYAGLLVTGLLGVRFGGYSYGLFWIKTAIGLYIAMALVAALGYTPTLKKQVQLLEAGNGGTPQYEAASKRGRILGAILGVMVIAIIFLMVTKPT